MAEGASRSGKEPRPPWGLVLAGGQGRRLGGLDKGQLRYGAAAEPQALVAWRTLARCCPRAFVSVRAEQAAASPYRDLPLVIDPPEGSGGPAAGLVAAWTQHPEAAWLVLATDLPRVDDALLDTLLRRRASDKLATVYRHEDGALEPLCAIWEPAAREPLLSAVAQGERSLRRLLERSVVEILQAPDTKRLVNVNSPADRAAVDEERPR